ncbi:hypothetical protein OGAPHI_005941 [Ogataea philodendri]|uniref:Sec39 domain-containing protein n=1 Tax=Ogataea philodendri TaxID=1378263 RepID=A0A9P8NWV9_9ASCO|nr:uncharacterized protein OGAPHI_005941 [Ogataea philodendri]KAH3661763.1 hypothetical protein OGAPHI_005941 [Ogataea philodendri]
MSSKERTHLALRAAFGAAKFPQDLRGVAYVLSPTTSLEILLVDLPEFIPLEQAVIAADQLLEPTESTQTLELPAELELPTALISSSVTKSVDYIRQQAARWHFDQEKDLFAQFVQARILKTNYYTGDLPDLETVQDLILNSSHASEPLAAWWNGFLVPMSNLGSFGEIPSLMDFVDYYSAGEQIDLFVSKLSGSNADDVVRALLSYLKYQDADFWAFNDYVLAMANTIVSTESTPELVKSKFDLLVTLVTSNDLLHQMPDASLQRLVSILLATVYMCSEISIQLYVKMKELLVYLNTIDPKRLQPNTEYTFVRQSSLDRMADSVVASPSSVQNLIQFVEIGERLFSNNLSLGQVAGLPNLNASEQLEQLERFVHTESAYLSSERDWEHLLSSVYWILRNTSVLNKVTLSFVDELVLNTLLNQGKFSTVSKVFVPKYCTLSTEEFDRIVMAAAWKFYNSATNCDSNIGHLKSAQQCAALAATKSVQLDELILANSELLHWKLYFKPGVPVTPSDIIEIKDPFTIISKVLELNEHAYLESDQLESVLKHLLVGLEVNDELAHVKLQLVCLDFAIACDFVYSLELATSLIQLATSNKTANPELFHIIQDKWFSIFQLVKTDYPQPEEHEQLAQKLDLLQRLMLIVPTEFNTNVLEQWQLLNSARDLVVAEKPAASQEKTEQPIDLGKNIIGWIVGAK